jgi:hypothetical protein
MILEKKTSRTKEMNETNKKKSTKASWILLQKEFELLLGE